MGNRRVSRELAMQALFSMDMNQREPEESLELYCRNFAPSEQALPFFLKLVEGVVRFRDEIDILIERYSSNWKVSRMASVDRNVLRLAVYELLFIGDIPAKVSINEAIDIGKKYGTDESGAFINGILDSIRKGLEAGEIKQKETPPGSEA
jgi:transcription antitermination protein NusB